MNNLPLKINNLIATENFKPLIDTNALELLGNSCLKKHNPNDDYNLFLDVYGLDCCFYYAAEQRCTINDNHTEVGIGHLVTDDSKCLLHRDKVLFKFSNNSIVPNNQHCPFKQQDRSDCLIVHTHLPTSLLELLAFPNSIIISNSHGLPSPLKVNENSLLIRLNDTIQSLSLKDLSSVSEFGNSVKESICKYTKQLVLKTSRLDVDKIATNHLLIKPSKTPLEKAGEIHFDESTKSLKFYDGTHWRYFFK